MIIFLKEECQDSSLRHTKTVDISVGGKESTAHVLACWHLQWAHIQCVLHMANNSPRKCPELWSLLMWSWGKMNWKHEQRMSTCPPELVHASILHILWCFDISWWHWRLGYPFQDLLMPGQSECSAIFSMKLQWNLRLYLYLPPLSGSRAAMYPIIGTAPLVQRPINSNDSSLKSAQLLTLSPHLPHKLQ